MPAENYYPEAEETEESVSPPESSEDSMSSTATLPKSIFGENVEVGQEATFRVVRVLEEEVEVEKTGGMEGPGYGGPPPAGPEIDAMASEE